MPGCPWAKNRSGGLTLCIMSLAKHVRSIELGQPITQNIGLNLGSPSGLAIFAFLVARIIKVSNFSVLKKGFRRYGEVRKLTLNFTYL